MKINCALHKIGLTTALLSTIFLGVLLSPAFAQDSLNKVEDPVPPIPIEDGYPFVFAKDLGYVAALWDRLEDQDEPVFDKAVYFQLRKQSAAYKDKKLHIQGRLLRAVRSPSGYCDLWVLLPDAKRDPVRVISKNAPAGFVFDDKLENDAPYDKTLKYRGETLIADAIYYRASSYDAGDDFYTVPTLVALDFKIQGNTRTVAEEEDSGRKRAANVYKFLIVAILLVSWFFVRRVVKSLRRPSKPNRDRATLPEKLGKFALLAALLACTPPGAAEEPDAFFAAAFSSPKEDWITESTGLRPALDSSDADNAAGRSRRREIALAALYRLRGLLNAAVMKEMVDGFPTETLGDYVASPQRNDNFIGSSFPAAGYYLGKLIHDNEIALNAAEEERYGIRKIYRAVLESPSGKRFVVYHDRLIAGDKLCAGLGIRFGREADAESVELPVVISPRIGRYDLQDPLSANGLDITTYDDVPVYPPDALSQIKDKAEQRAAAKSLRWTTADSAPFYQTLAAVKRMRAGEDKRPAVTDVVPLFNEPQHARGKRVKLSGWARRVNAILVEDPEVVASTGIERYYQVYIYTNESQGWPLVLCVPELPKGMETGGGTEYRRFLEFTGYFYKTWAYKNSESPNASEEELPQDNWTKAPVLVGKIDRVEPEESPATKSPLSPKGTAVLFVALVLAWIVLRRLSK